MRRGDNWRERLNAFLQEAATTPFVWGRRDCVLFAADAVLVMTGEDPAAEIRGRYETAIGAARITRKISGGPWIGTGVAARFAEIAPAFAGDGDLAMVREIVPGKNGRTRKQDALGVFTGARVAVMMPRGCGHISRIDARVVTAFKVP